MYLLDTNVLSELRKQRRGLADKNVIQWVTAQSPATLYLSAITILELEVGARQIARRDLAQGEHLRQWMETQVLRTFAGRILSIDSAVAQQCAALSVPDPRPKWDSLIAATALVHGMTVVTRNVSDFEPTGVRIVNPWLSR